MVRRASEFARRSPRSSTRALSLSLRRYWHIPNQPAVHHSEQRTSEEKVCLSIYGHATAMVLLSEAGPPVETACGALYLRLRGHRQMV